MIFVPDSASGFEQITGLSTKKSLTIPSGAKGVLVQAETQNVRWRGGGTDPSASVGMILYSTDPPTLFTETMFGTVVGDSRGLAAIEFIEVTASAKLNCQYLYEL